MSHNEDSFMAWLMLPFTLILILMLMVYEDGSASSFYNKMKCRYGRHTFKSRFGNRKLYYCRTCKKRRDHPVLNLIVGQKKVKYKHYKG